MAKATKAKASKAKAKTSKSKSTKTAKAKATKSKAKKPSRPAAKVKADKADTADKAELQKLDETGRRVEEKPVKNDRRKNHRRRHIDPTTCEREYKDAEIEFMHALDEYKQASGRMFPTCSEILEVLTKLGYRQVAEPQELYSPDSQTNAEKSEEDIEFEDSDLEPVA